MSKEKNEDIRDDIHSESEIEEPVESNEVSDEERIAELEDTILRLRAELDNSQKRSVAEVEKAHKYGVEIPTSVEHAYEIDERNGIVFGMMLLRRKGQMLEFLSLYLRMTNH